MEAHAASIKLDYCIRVGSCVIEDPDYFIRVFSVGWDRVDAKSPDATSIVLSMARA